MTDQLPVAPAYTINPSTVQAVVRTGGSLIVFAVGFATTLAKLLSAHDLAGVYVYLQQNDTIAGLTMLATAGWFIWRTVTAFFKKRRDVVIANAAPDTVAIVKGS